MRNIIIEQDIKNLTISDISVEILSLSEGNFNTIYLRCFCFYKGKELSGDGVNIELKISDTKFFKYIADFEDSDCFDKEANNLFKMLHDIYKTEIYTQALNEIQKRLTTK